MPTIAFIAGDIHLGGRNGSGAAFPGWLDDLAARPPARLILLGDLFEYWVETASCATRHEDVLARLRHLRELGWTVDLVRGNREAVAGRLLEISAGSHLCERLDLQVGTRVLRVVHGDRLIHDPGYRAYATLMAAPFAGVYRALHPAVIHELVARWLRRRSLAKQRNQQRRYRRIFLDPRRVRAAARGADLLVAGHIHERWRRQVGGIDLTLVGDWPDGHASWVEVRDDGTLEQRFS